VEPSTKATPRPWTAWIRTTSESHAAGSREKVTPLATAGTMLMRPTAISALSPGIPWRRRYWIASSEYRLAITREYALRSPPLGTLSTDWN
jgi:hypothetical protein